LFVTGEGITTSGIIGFGKSEGFSTRGFFPKCFSASFLT
jgi:hypothetical protein